MLKHMKISIVIPAYNEEETICDVIFEVNQLPFEKEIIVIDDGSYDHTWKRLTEMMEEHLFRDVKCYRHTSNKGKGAAIHSGLQHVTGEIVIIQDADLEYNPEDIVRVITPIQYGECAASYGSRLMIGKPDSMKWYTYLANTFLTHLTNVFTGQELTDMETCYKAVSTRVIRMLKLESRSYTFEPEITIKLSQLGVKIKETPISYVARTKEEGKKISFLDGIRALYTIWRYCHGYKKDCQKERHTQEGVQAKEIKGFNGYTEASKAG